MKRKKGQQNEGACGTETPDRSNISAVENISPDPAVPGTSSMGQISVIAKNPYSDQAIAGPSTMTNQSYYPGAALPESSFSARNGPSADEKCPPNDSTANATVVYEDLLVPYCKNCQRIAIGGDGKKVELCNSCNLCVIYMCAVCHNCALDTYELGVTHLNRIHHLYQKLFCPICFYETHDEYVMSNHMSLHDKKYDDMSSDD